MPGKGAQVRVLSLQGPHEHSAAGRRSARGGGRAGRHPDPASRATWPSSQSRQAHSQVGSLTLTPVQTPSPGAQPSARQSSALSHAAAGNSDGDATGQLQALQQQLQEAQSQVCRLGGD